jgi:hypothetical protein
MRTQSLAWLLILLLSSALVDDAFAATTVETDDDVLTAENNQYLHFTSRCPQQRSGKTDVTQPGVPVAAVVSLPALFAGRWPSTDAEPTALAGPPLLYLLMSLQR